MLLYNIPIVSLYIEGQERLCLAQISNTLLKQFSYNEIHNRRVALGITCVQCTPVQLEILRRAGAMPVSSRRCGMITRREAERLCKSFLGDNTPPRLPDDFAFNVQHKCSWGCRGSFLPSRYNSSRAKCIKCHYCGMFFSPNKFIFHSHRIGPGDKYVQPDAANFNSWRRHMMLSGQPPQEVIYAWEDVKAMFNGGTRKRIITSNSSSPSLRASTASPNSCSAGTSSISINRDHSMDDNLSVNGDSLSNSSENLQKSSHNSVNTVTAAAAAVVGVTAVAVGSSVRPLNLHFQTSTTTGLATESSYTVGTDMHLIPAAALSRSFMMDYMWRHAKSNYSQNYQQPKIKSTNSAFTFPWINTNTDTISEVQSHDNHHSSINYSPSINTCWSNVTSTSDIARNLTQIINTSAFKPVVQMQQSEENLKSRRCQSLTQSSGKFNKISVLASLNCTDSSPMRNNLCNSISSSDEDNHDDEQDIAESYHRLSPINDNVTFETEHSELLEDDVLVDIETTEDEKPINASSLSNTTVASTSSRISFTFENSESHDEVDKIDVVNENKALITDDDVIDVEHNDNDEDDIILEFTSSSSSLSILKHKKETDDHKSLCTSSTPFTPSITTSSTNIDYSNAENVPPMSLSSPKSNSNSPYFRPNECFNVKNKNFYEITYEKSAATNHTSRSPEIFEEQKTNITSNLEVSIICSK